ncbi:MAG TPA: hypothetical protein VF787_03450 [Thermoanaerobaculia bacterium]
MKPVSRWEGDAAAWADRLWAHAKHLSKGLTGEQVTQALADSADEVYNAGLDELFDGFRSVPFRRRGGLWDAAWLPVFITHLNRKRRRS